MSATIAGKTRYLHRVILDAPKGLDVDHIDGDPLNNSRRNLRLCSRRQNLAACTRRVNKGTGYRGVYASRQGYGFYAQIKRGELRRHLGTFPTAADAAMAYNEAALELYGEFAFQNVSPLNLEETP